MTVLVKSQKFNALYSFGFSLFFDSLHRYHKIYPIGSYWFKNPNVFKALGFFVSIRWNIKKSNVGNPQPKYLFIKFLFL